MVIYVGYLITVPSGVPQVSHNLWPVLFLAYINDILKTIESVIMLLANDAICICAKKIHTFEMKF